MLARHKEWSTLQARARDLAGALDSRGGLNVMLVGESQPAAALRDQQRLDLAAALVPLDPLRGSVVGRVKRPSGPPPGSLSRCRSTALLSIP